MGLLGLSVTIRFNLARDFTTAWYAVSLLPRTVVAGQGVRLWLMWPIIAMVILVPTAHITNDVYTLITVSIVTSLLAVASFFLILMLRIRREHRTPVRRLVRRLVLVLIVLYIPATLGSLIMTQGAKFLAQFPTEATFFSGALDALGIAVDKNSFAIGIILILLGGFVIGVPSAIVFRPPLPLVTLEMPNETSSPSIAMKQGSNPLVGWLVAHSDGYWHLFLDESRELQSIPDEKVRLARTGEEGQTPPWKKEAASSEEATPEKEEKPGEGKTE
jgi:hypothetical protein